MPRAQSESLRIYIARAINYKFSKHFAKIKNIGPNWVSLDCTPDFCIIAKIPKYSPLDTRFFLLLQLNVNRSPYLDTKTKTFFPKSPNCDPNFPAQCKTQCKNRARPPWPWTQ